jgi:hypothetical protein
VSLAGTGLLAAVDVRLAFAVAAVPVLAVGAWLLASPATRTLGTAAPPPAPAEAAPEDDSQRPAAVPAVPAGDQPPENRPPRPAVPASDHPPENRPPRPAAGPAVPASDQPPDNHPPRPAAGPADGTDGGAAGVLSPRRP